MDKRIKKLMELWNVKPRDKNRIEPFLKRFQKSWESEPDLRFGQMVMILFQDRDCWNWEIEKWYELLDEFDNRGKQK